MTHIVFVSGFVLMLSRFFIPANSYHLQINPTEMTMENHLHFNQILLVLMLSRFFIYYYTLQINRTETTMENCLHFNQILLVLALPVLVTQATVVQNKFKKLEPGESIMGTIGAEVKARSRRECAVRQVSTALEY